MLIYKEKETKTCCYCFKTISNKDIISNKDYNDDLKKKGKKVDNSNSSFCFSNFKKKIKKFNEIDIFIFNINGNIYKMI